MTLPTNDQIILAVFVLAAALIAAILTRRSSIKASIQHQRACLNIAPGDPENAWIDTSASFGANVVSFLWCMLGSYLAVAILSGDLTWPALFWVH